MMQSQIPLGHIANDEVASSFTFHLLSICFTTYPLLWRSMRHTGTRGMTLVVLPASNVKHEIRCVVE